MTKIVDLMRSIIGIFNEHAGEDNLLDKEELKAMMGQELPEVFSSEARVNELVAHIDKDFDGKISFDEFIKSMAFICNLLKVDNEAAADGNSESRGGGGAAR
ncbi:Oidioi.mRNA.OKI2018_I69.chr1.g3644.t1.cds [Oikopleura dioica]|uniref:Oidioi.mRNA.OKI2018_I69.chr1.g3644.t1.cds n=1 Tax=Oikopleura dioica TaxID=34765 RepID=A0ABN7T1M6_OIKDI|nr:Oidioi.mRNA.OKI2018_I69.chr1.g3644.t1.cds [Oikopleura dioica]